MNILYDTEARALFAIFIMTIHTQENVFQIGTSDAYLTLHVHPAIFELSTHFQPYSLQHSENILLPRYILNYKNKQYSLLHCDII